VQTSSLDLTLLKRMRLQLGQSIGESLCTQGAVKLHPSTGKHVESDEPLLGRSIMGTSEGYGQRLAERLRAEQTHAIVTRVLRTADMAVTETGCDNPVLGLSHSIQREDAYLVRFAIFPIANIGRTDGKCRCVTCGPVRLISMT